jgi:hypothetical protein
MEAFATIVYRGTLFGGHATRLLCPPSLRTSRLLLTPGELRSHIDSDELPPPPKDADRPSWFGRGGSLAGTACARLC